MERSDVILRAASDLRMRYAPEVAALPVHASALVERLCAALGLELAVVAGADAMLGGACSRLQLWDWAQPEFGGLIWIRSDLTPEQQAFAIAHELGHFSLHRGEGVSIHPVCNQEEVDERADPGDLRVESRRVEEYTPRARRELEANAFAAELLAPRLLVRRCFAASDGMDSVALAGYFGISPVLARQRLVDAVLSAARPIADAYEPEVATGGNGSGSLNAAVLIAGLDPSQQEAARTPGPALIVAGPGTGKTATLVGRVAHLIAERGIQPERVLALTFSNRAAGEMRGRLVQAGLPGERMPVMTIHAFAAALLREYAAHVPCAPGERQLEPDFRILDEADAFLLMEELLAELPLHYYRSLGNPTYHLRTLLADFAHARDNLLTPDAYLALVDAMPLEVVDSAGDGASSGKRPRTAGIQPRSGTYTLEQIARARERARAYGVWDRALRQRGLVDFGGLIQRAVELLRADPVVLAEVHWRYPEVLVDEFQDTNRAAAELLLLIAGDAGQGLWVVGDRNQSIYRWRGASPANLQRLAERYPALRVHTLRRCYRSVPAIVQLGSAIASRMADLAMPGSASDAAKGQMGDSAPAGASMRAMAGFPMADSTPAVLKDMWRPLELEPVRPDGPHPAVLRGAVFGSAAQEQAGLAMAIRRHRTQGFSYSDQAVLCRTHRQAYRIATALVAEGVPVDQIGGFFERPEIKDARALLSLAAGPDVRGLLRAGALLAGLGYPVPAADEIAAVIRGLLRVRQALPDVLIRPDLLTGTVELTPATREALRALGQVAIALRYSSTVSSGLVRFLLRPGGYAWRLLRIADGMDSPALPGSASAWPADMVSFATSSAQAQAALAALGELVRLAVRFDSRWTREEDFRVRLSRAVMHWQPDSIAVAPAAPQTATTDSGAPALAADVRDGKVLTDITADVGASDLLPVVPVVSCFLYYLDALRAAGVTVPLPAGEEDAVHVLTLHASKGLEFPVGLSAGACAGAISAEQSQSG